MLIDSPTRAFASRRNRLVRPDREPAKLLLRHTRMDGRLRGEKALERLRAWCPTCREPLGVLTNDAVVVGAH